MEYAASAQKAFPTNRGVAPATPAPLRFEGKGQYDVPPDELFSMVSEPGNLHRWLPIRSVEMDHTASEQKGACGVGSVRMCSFRGMGDVEEGVFWWNPPHGYAFRFTPQGRAKLSMPTKDHVVYFLVESDGGAGSVFTFRVHFNWTGLLMRHMAVHMMPIMLNQALANLKRELGGKGGMFRRVA